MNFSLTSPLNTSFEHKGNDYSLCMTFDNVLLLFKMFDDELLSEMEKIGIALDMLIYEFDDIKFESFEEMANLFKYIMLEFLDIDLYEKEKDFTQSEEEDDSPQVKFMDYEKDAEIIYASFMAAYRIDLFEQQGIMDFRKFNALLNHIDDESKFKKVIGYRTAKVPTGKHVDPEQVKHIRRMKRIYSLEDEETKSQEASRTLSQFAKQLRSKSDK